MEFVPEAIVEIGKSIKRYQATYSFFSLLNYVKTYKFNDKGRYWMEYMI